nr:serine hydrolase domain-containing protein [Micromonospora sp. DSM 115978]
MTLAPETARRLDTLVAQAQVAGRTPALVAGVVRDGELAHVAAAGDHPAPGPDLQYRIGSITKTMTAVLLLGLRDEGRLGLDDPVEGHLPGTPVGTVTLRQLLSHGAGLQREPDGQWWERTEGADLAGLLAGLTPAKLVHPPHRRHHYSNLAYGLLGAVAERAGGQPWWPLLRARVLDPLGLTRTSFHPVEPYARGFVAHPWHGTLREEPRTDTGAMAPAGQLWSTVRDLARWAAFLAEPDPGVLAADTLAEMCATVQMADPESWTAGHGLGLELVRHGDRVFVGHGGSMPGYVATLLVHRPTRTAVVGYANAYGLRNDSIRALGLRLLTTLLDREPPAPTPWRPAASAPADVVELTGRWWWMGREYEAGWADGELVLRHLDAAAGQPWRFAPAGTDRWRGRSGMNNGETLLVRRDAAGRVRTLDIATFVFTRDPDDLG